MEGSEDPKHFTHMPGFYIHQFREDEFASREFNGKDSQTVAVAGY